MLVIKRRGNKQDFQIDKIKVSIMRASDDIDEPLNESDISFIVSKVKDSINDKYSNEIKSSDIHNIVVEILNSTGFSKIAKAYIEGAK